MHLTKLCRATVAILTILACTAILPFPALAYTDPGTASILVQLLLGGVGGGLVILKLYWYRFKSFFQRDQRTATAETSDSEQDGNS